MAVYRLCLQTCRILGDVRYYLGFAKIYRTSTGLCESFPRNQTLFQVISLRKDINKFVESLSSLESLRKNMYFITITYRILGTSIQVKGYP